MFLVFDEVNPHNVNREVIEVAIPKGIHTDILRRFRESLQQWSPQSEWRFTDNPSISRPKITDHQIDADRAQCLDPTGSAAGRNEEIHAQLSKKWARALTPP